MWVQQWSGWPLRARRLCLICVIIPPRLVANCFNRSLDVLMCVTFSYSLFCGSYFFIDYVLSIQIMISYSGGWMYVINGSHFVPLEGKFLLVTLFSVRITLNVIVRQMPLNVKLLNTWIMLFPTVAKTLSKCLRVWQQVFERWTHRCLADI